MALVTVICANILHLTFSLLFISLYLTVSYPEFEEMFIRCAFHCWESSGAITGSEPSPISLLFACTGSTEEASHMGLKDVVYKYCIEGMQSMNREDKSVTTSWGSDFIGPYSRTLFALSPLPHKVAVAAIDKEIEFANIKYEEEMMLRELEEKARQLEEELKRERALQAKMLELDRTYVDAYMAPREPVSALISDQRPPEVDNMQALMDKTEYLKNPSLGINLLLDGTKEELWPVYATYCSCGDSTDPGKLSGPNLFTLLSKLSILNDRTVLSDIGMLLHQISAHLHAQSSLSLASLSSVESIESPSLSFEQFLVFLCAYSQQFFDSGRESPLSFAGTLNLSTASLSDPLSVKREAIRQIYAEAKEGRLSPTTNSMSGSRPVDTSYSDLDSCSSSPLFANTNTNNNTYTNTNNKDNNKDNNSKISAGSFPGSFKKKRPPGSSCLNVILSSDPGISGGSASISRTWFAQWREYMNSSYAFRSLLEDHMLPVLRGRTLLAFPDDARLRDKYAVLFSLEVLLTLQRVEPVLRSVFVSEGSASLRWSEDSSKGKDSPLSMSVQMIPIISALRRINLVPQVIGEAHITQLMQDVMPERLASTSCSIRSLSPLGPSDSQKSIVRDSEDRERERERDRARFGGGELLFSHWEWVVCVVAYEAMDSAVRLSSTKTDPEVIYQYN